MKKHIISIIIVLCILGSMGAGVWFLFNKPHTKSLYSACTDFTVSKDTADLTTNIARAQELYSNSGGSADTRVLRLLDIITKLDDLQSDVNSYLILSEAKPDSTKSLSKKYDKLQSGRASLIKNYNEYNTRMAGNIHIDGTAVRDLYNNIFDKTVSYIYNYNLCFSSVADYVFTKTYTSSNIKREVYLLYSASVSNLLNNISNHAFVDSGLTTVTRLNNAIQLNNGVLQINSSLQGGEFSAEARNFKSNFNGSNAIVLANSFEEYYKLSINVDVETSKEKLAVHYIKIVLEV